MQGGNEFDEQTNGVPRQDLVAFFQKIYSNDVSKNDTQ